MQIRNRWNRFSRVDEGAQNLFAVSAPFRNSAWPDQICMMIQDDSISRRIESYYSAPFCTTIQSAGVDARARTGFIISQEA